jgi:hypothetical protein
MASVYWWGAILLIGAALFAGEFVLGALFGEFWGTVIATLILGVAILAFVFWRFRSSD